jgi:polar amino acid transport system substrate-binding protein
MGGNGMRRLAAAICMMLVMVFTLSACTSTANNNILEVGVDDVYPPMEFKDDAGTTMGFDIDLATEIGKKLNMEVKFTSTAWDGIFTALKAKKFDCIISSLSINEDRQKNYALTNAYIANSQVIVVSKNNTTIKSEKDLAGKKVGVQINTTADESCTKYLETMKFDVQKYDQIIQPFSDLKTGRLDAIVVDEVVAKYYISKDSASFALAGGKLTNEPIGIAFRINDTAMRDKVQKALDDLRADGTLKKISIKWFGEDLTSNIK